MKLKPIAVIHTDFKEKFGLPRQSGRVPELTGRIVFFPEFRHPEALRGIEDYSHLWLIFHFSAVEKTGWSATVRPPRLGGNKRVGVFATRSPYRPNPLGLSSVRLLGTEETENEGTVLLVSGVDLLDGTPIFDIKPYLPQTDSHPDAKGGFSDEHWQDGLSVVFPDALLERIPADKRDALRACLSDDPRPSYQNDPHRVYTMSYADFEISFTVNGDILTVSDVK